MEKNPQTSLADKQTIKKYAIDSGYSACGFTDTEPFSDYEESVRMHMEEFPEAAALYTKMLGRVDPKARTPWAQSIIVCIRHYGKYKIPESLKGYIGRNYLFDCRTSACPDYDIRKKFQNFMSSMGIRYRHGGVPDRWAAARAGVAQIGRNCFAFSKHGSWINIETWLTNQPFPPDEPTPETPCPPGCNRCIEECPTAALKKPYIMNMTHCIAYLTYSAPEPIQTVLRNKMGKWIYGCDRCQEVCPLNTDKWKESEPAPWLKKHIEHLSPQALAKMDEKTFEEIVRPLFWYIPPENLARWHANAKRALEHSDANSF